MKNRNRFAALAAIAACFALAGCGPMAEAEEREPKDPHHTSVIEQELEDGRTVTCVWAEGARAGGLSCDWANAK